MMLCAAQNPSQFLEMLNGNIQVCHPSFAYHSPTLKTITTHEVIFNVIQQKHELQCIHGYDAETSAYIDFCRLKNYSVSIYLLHLQDSIKRALHSV